ncbi:HAD-IA family hydrolase [Nocardioides sp. CN2-186]|uniref:HAD family hydrolase n=1 Tax=Nocardioides tweenelious TaxID=3156607 RepID=UPI0032B49E6E
MTRDQIRHVLLDADEVVQHPGRWDDSAASVTARLTPEFLADIGELQQPGLRGEIDVLEAFDALARRHGIDAVPSVLVAAMWGSIVVDPASLSLVDELRAAGYGVHLGTNQDTHRARYMRETLGYDDLFDIGVYSCDIGVAKPDPAYFQKAVSLIGAPAETVFFVDDKQANVDGARSVGLVAERWELAEGHERLRGLLAEHGILRPSDR